MDKFDQIPARSRQSRGNSPLATKPKYTFDNGEPAPKGLRYQTFRDGLEVSFPVRVPLMFTVLGLISGAIVSMLYHTAGNEEIPMSFTIVMSLVLGLTLLATTYFILGRQGVRIKGEKIYLRKSLFGIAVSKSMFWHRLERVRVLSRVGKRGLGIVVVSKTSDQILEFESDTHIYTIGDLLKEDQRYYIRHVVLEYIKKTKFQITQSTANQSNAMQQ